MTDYIKFDIRSTLDRVKIREILRDALPEYSWRAGDSDAIGGYVSGRNEHGVSVKIWTGQDPYEAAISYRSTALDEAVWPEVTERLLEIVSARIGAVEPA